MSDPLINPGVQKPSNSNKYVKLEELKNVDAKTNGLHSRDTVVFNKETQMWETKPIEDVVTEEVNVDGGSF